MFVQSNLSLNLVFIQLAEMHTSVVKVVIHNFTVVMVWNFELTVRI